jgi:hypothetical protein
MFLCLEIIQVVLCSHDCLPFSIEQDIVLATEKYPHHQTHGIGKNHALKAFENLAFVFVVILPRASLACLQRTPISDQKKP